MSKFVLRRVLLISAALGASLLVTQPTLAFQQTGTTGTVGVHSVTDTSSSPGAVCVYPFNSSADLYQLKHINVKPPNMKAVASMGTEKVGWQFTVQRKVDSGSWSNRYTSPVYTATTNSSTNAAFTQKGVKVIVPYGPTDIRTVYYRVVLKGIWYKSNGTSVLGTFSGRVQWYTGQENPDNMLFHYSCQAWDNGGGI